MKVSVIIPSYNHSLYVADAIGSVLDQDYPNLELIVLDDGSSDDSPKILQDLSLKHGFNLTLKENEGLCKTLNRGIAQATGDFVIFLASDDMMTPNRVKEQVDFMFQNSDVDVAAGGMKLISEDGTYLGVRSVKKPGTLDFATLIAGNQVNAPTAIFRRSVFEKYGIFPEDFIFEDYYMWLNISKQGGVIQNTDKVWVVHRLASQENLEKKFRWYFKGEKQVLSNYLEIEAARKELERLTSRYCIKMTLLLGREFLKEGVMKELPFWHKSGLGALAWVPRKARVSLLMKLLYRT